MNARKLLRDLRSRGVAVREADGFLELDVPTGVLDDALLREVAEHKPHLLTFLEWERQMLEEDILIPRRPTSPESKRLLAAGWEPKERSGLVIWSMPGGSWYSEEVAVLLLARDGRPP